MPSYDITEFDLIFLSYDEPNAEKNYADLLDKAPWAKRVHGVRGFDAAHRACAELSETPWFVTVDADNVVHPAFFEQKVELDQGRRPRECRSWNAFNVINGLMYGNGGLKLWSKEFVLNMNTHENADDPRKAVDFCWEEDYVQVHKCFSDVHNNATPYQAYRVGFREGVKLSLDRGERVVAEDMKARLHPMNLRNLRIWSSVGADVENGVWAMLGTRLGWIAMMDPKFDHTMVRDYEWFNARWISLQSTMGSEQAVISQLEKFGEIIKAQSGIRLPNLDSAASEFFRETFHLRNE